MIATTASCKKSIPNLSSRERALLHLLWNTILEIQRQNPTKPITSRFRCWFLISLLKTDSRASRKCDKADARDASRTNNSDSRNPNNSIQKEAARFPEEELARETTCGACVCSSCVSHCFFVLHLVGVHFLLLQKEPYFVSPSFPFLFYILSF
ncbi:MAG: hypothetical protein Q8P67_11935, partial [archaeon]|nr:hypothetical protein [archaeon]